MACRSRRHGAGCETGRRPPAEVAATASDRPALRCGGPELTAQPRDRRVVASDHCEHRIALAGIASGGSEVALQLCAIGEKVLERIPTLLVAPELRHTSGGFEVAIGMGEIVGRELF